MNLALGLRERSVDTHSFAFRTYAAAARASSRRVLNSEHQVDDVVQRVFEDLWDRPERFNPTRGPLVAYVKVQARARSIDLVRSETRRRGRERELDRATDLIDLDDPMDQCLASSSNDELRRRVDQLPEIERVPIVLSFYGQMSYRAVARRLGLPEGTVKARIRRGLTHLGTILNEAEETLQSLDFA
jgi:RNA polymerase sigma-70 factor, ECF subfamily